MALCVVIEDQPLQRRTLERTLRESRHQVVTCGTGSEGLDLTRAHRPELILLDLGLPDGDGIDLIPGLLAASPLSRILVLTGRDSVREAVSALRSGARHYLAKPWDRDELLLIVEREAAAVNREELHRREARTEMFWGHDRRMRAIRADLEKLRASPCTPMLVQGETGTGKEVVARELHDLTDPTGPFVAVNCAALPRELMESELFGHERGAFTGAETRKRGVVELAADGTLFLDEVSEMSPHLQAKLLRFLQDGSFRRVGAESELTARCRVVAATHADLGRRQGEGSFRPDLYYRLAVVRVTLPPLRERSGDLLPLTHFLLERVARRLGCAPRALSPRAEAAILAHGWPGNVRELANRVERALVLGGGDQIEPLDLDLESAGDAPTMGDLRVLLQDPQRLRLLIEEEDWNLSAVARRLGVERHKVKYRVRALGLRRPENQ